MTCDCSAGQPGRSGDGAHLANSIFTSGSEGVSTKDLGYGRAEANHLVPTSASDREGQALARPHFATFVDACYTIGTMADVVKVQSQLLYRCRIRRRLLPPRSLSQLS